jgi:hypothetical protein
MASAKKRTGLAVALSVAALGFGVATTYGLHVREHVRPPSHGASVARSAGASICGSGAGIEESQGEDVVYVPPVTIVAPWPQRTENDGSRAP